MNNEQVNKAHRTSKKGAKAKKIFKENVTNAKAFTFGGGKISNLRKVQRDAEVAQKRVKHLSAKSKVETTIDPPFNVVVHGTPGSGKTTLLRSLIKHYSCRNVMSVKGPVTVVSSKNRRLTFIECPNEICSMLDLAKVADLVILVIDLRKELEKDTLEFISILKTHGFPRLICLTTFNDDDSVKSNLKKLRKKIKKRLWADLYDGVLVFNTTCVKNNYFSRRDMLNLAKFISVQKFKPLVWQSSHPYILCHNLKVVETNDEDETCSIDFLGYLKGSTALNKQPFCLPGCGIFTADEISSLQDPCPLEASTMEVAKGGTLSKLRINTRKIYAPHSSIGKYEIEDNALYIKKNPAKLQMLQKQENSEISDERSGNETDPWASSDSESDSYANTDSTYYNNNDNISESDDEERNLNAYTSKVWSDDEFEDTVHESSTNELDELINDTIDRTHDFSNSNELKFFISSRAIYLQPPIEEFARLSALDINSLHANADLGSIFSSDRAELSFDETFKDLNDKYTIPYQLKLAHIRSYVNYVDTEVDDSIIHWDDSDNSDGNESVTSDTKISNDVSASDDAVSEHLINSNVGNEAADNSDESDDLGENSHFSNSDKSDDLGKTEDGESIINNDDMTYHSINTCSSLSNSSSALLDAAKFYESGHKARSGDREDVNTSNFTVFSVDAFVASLKFMKYIRQCSCITTSFLSDGLSPTTIVSYLSYFNRLSQLSAVDTEIGISKCKVGSFVRIRLTKISLKWLTEFEKLSNYKPLILGGLQASETTLTFLNCKVIKHRWQDRLLKSTEPLLFSVGWHRYQSLPYFAMEDRNSVRIRFLKYTPQTLHCLMFISGFAVPPGTGILALKYWSRDYIDWRISLVGSVTEVTPKPIIVKKLKLIGDVKRVVVNTAYITNMFHSRKEVARVIGAKIQTSSCIRGVIKNFDGDNGDFRATFEAKIRPNDTIIMKSWVPVPLEPFVNPMEDLTEWDRLRTFVEIRRDLLIGRDEAKIAASAYKSRDETPALRFNKLHLKPSLVERLPFSSVPKEALPASVTMDEPIVTAHMDEHEKLIQRLVTESNIARKRQYKQNVEALKSKHQRRDAQDRYNKSLAKTNELNTFRKEQKKESYKKASIKKLNDQKRLFIK